MCQLRRAHVLLGEKMFA
uniref:Uncharacterized protein n=1 Tax=Anguilla anguilla TaxID=7936 RepID=A0A0E9RGB9_ANGAN